MGSARVDQWQFKALAVDPWVMGVIGGTFLARTWLIMHAVEKPTPFPSSMQGLCHGVVAWVRAGRGGAGLALRALACFFFLCLY
jgi:hypothetical protein